MPRSIWTIDLAHLLAGCGLTPAFRTTMPGVNPGYAGERFYAEQLAEDAVRVGRLFQVRRRGAGGLAGWQAGAGLWWCALGH